MQTLKEAAQAIQSEKNNKILAQNIKKDITIFDITGTYEGSSSSTNKEYFVTETAVTDGYKISYGYKYNDNGTIRTSITGQKTVKGYYKYLSNDGLSGFYFTYSNDDKKINDLMYFNNTEYNMSSKLFTRHNGNRQIRFSSFTSAHSGGDVSAVWGASIDLTDLVDDGTIPEVELSIHS